jgi:hypothetical protein
LPFARIFFFVVVLISAAAASAAALRGREFIGRPSVWPRDSMSSLPLRTPADALRQTPVLMLIPLVTFVAFNTVFSPQFHIWLMGPAALCAAAGEWSLAVLLSVATALTPVFYPSPTYVEGLDTVRSVVLATRNILMVYIAARWTYRCYEKE